MNESSFVERREPDWKRITQLCDKAEYTPTSLTKDELSEFISLYRTVSGDLALVRTKSTNVDLAHFLNDLVGRAYGVLYQSRRKPIRSVLTGTIATVAQTVRRRKWFMLASASLFICSGIFMFVLLSVRPDAYQQLVTNSGMGDLFREWKTGNMPERDFSKSFGMSGFYAAHNPVVAIISGSIAASTFGIGTVAMLLSNGNIIGMLSYEMNSVGKLGFLYASILPHGVPELSGLVISGAAGLCMGWALIVPGRRRRSEALKEAGTDAIVLLGASIVMMLIAAPIEGFFSFNPAIPSWVKVVVICVEVAIWSIFWIGYGREQEVRATAID